MKKILITLLAVTLLFAGYNDFKDALGSLTYANIDYYASSNFENPVAWTMWLVYMGR